MLELVCADGATDKQNVGHTYGAVITISRGKISFINNLHVLSFTAVVIQAGMS